MGPSSSVSDSHWLLVSLSLDWSTPHVPCSCDAMLPRHRSAWQQWSPLCAAYRVVWSGIWTTMYLGHALLDML
jgi:hypothetical protein